MSDYDAIDALTHLAEEIAAEVRQQQAGGATDAQRP